MRRRSNVGRGIEAGRRLSELRVGVDGRLSDGDEASADLADVPAKHDGIGAIARPRLHPLPGCNVLSQAELGPVWDCPGSVDTENAFA